MGISSLPVAGGGGIKLVQRGEAVASGNITITSVDTTKTFVRSFSNSASGAAASDSSTSGTLNPSGGNIVKSQGGNNFCNPGSFPNYIGTRSFSGGTTTLASKEFGVYLSNATTLVASGPCFWEVVEFV